jgi:hypothetical protein
MTNAFATPALSDSFVRNCLIIPRIDATAAATEGPCMFVQQEIDGEIITTARLDGYAIIPREEYERLRALAQ